MNLNSSPCHFPVRQISDDCDHHHPNFVPNCSQSSVSFRIFFNSTQDHLGCYDRHQSLHPYHQSDDNGAYNQGGSSTPGINSDVEGGLKLTLWKNEDHGHRDHGHGDQGMPNDNNPKSMSSKMRLMQKVKNPDDRVPLNINNAKLEDQKFRPSIDHLSSNNFSYNNSPIRVCADCNTTKTPLWRSGPNGPKSLCNACGIRQRKARRALAAAEAASDQPPAMKIKVQHKENISKIKGRVKKRCKTTAAATGSDGSLPTNRQQKLRFEDFLINLSKKLAFHRKFPEDEKDAAILLMAISSGLVHG